MTETTDITNVTNEELKNILGMSATKTIEVSVDFLHGYFILNHGTKFTDGKHKRYVKDSLDFIKKEVSAFGFKFVSFVSNELIFCGPSRGWVTYHTIEVE